MENANSPRSGETVLDEHPATTPSMPSTQSTEHDGATTDGFFVSAPTVSLPKSGGAIRGIGEKLSVNPATGTGSLAVPIETSSGRSGFGPQLSLTYDSGAGNGPFGMGWQLSPPAVTRRTDKGIPRYRDTDDSDVFVLSGSDDLVPVDVAGVRHEDRTSAPGFVIHRYRPRVESAFARIDRWTRVGDAADVHWRIWSRDNVLTVFGEDTNSRIADPEDARRIFSWLVCEMRDDKGNAVLYRYKAEDGTNVDLTDACETNRGPRSDARRTANRYLKHIRYGNRVPLLADDATRPIWLTEPQIDAARWMFQVVFDYGEHDLDAPTPGDAGAWLARRDPFSTRRAGFEVRTHRLCRRVLMFHHFATEPGVGVNTLVRATSFEYRQTSVSAFLTTVTPRCYRREPGGYLTRSMPRLELDYSQPVIGSELADVDATSLENLPTGAWGPPFVWADLDGEGVTGLLSEQSRGWHYKRNESPLNRVAAATNWPVRFAAMETVASIPGLGSLSDPTIRLLDLAGDGQLDVVQYQPPLTGFYERDDANGWHPLRPFESIPNVPWDNPHLRLIDLTGDGLADILVTEGDELAWHASLGERGFDEQQRSSLADDEERCARVVFADATASIVLADMSGDGLADIVRVTNGAVCYWPSSGYGRFGPRIPMGNAPWLASTEEFDARRVRLIDIDGSGPTDMVYMGSTTTRCWLNEAGNGWGDAIELTAFPPVDDVAAVTAADVLGNGTAALVWSSPLAGHIARPMKVLNLMAEGKPNLLTGIRNNLGAETRIHYAPSTYFALKDRAEGHPWITRLPFPVQVVERVEVDDRVSGNRFVTRYSYHHGHFDGAQREFRGFGRVDQLDTEDIGALRPDGSPPNGANFDETSWTAPTLTKTWFHTGVFAGRERVSRYFAGLQDSADAGEYYREPGWTDQQARDALLDDTTIPDGLTAPEEVDACRALRGSVLRQELYALDGTLAEQHPYVVTEHSYALRLLQPRGRNADAAFFVRDDQVLTYRYERNPADPRISHQLILQVDPFGTVGKEAAVSYGRRAPVAAELLRGSDHDRQAHALVTYAEHRVTNHIDTSADHRAPVRCETRGYELTGYLPSGVGGRYRTIDFVVPGAAPETFSHRFDSEISYEATPTTGRQRRCVDHSRTLFRPNDFGAAAGSVDALLALGVLQSLALQGQSYELAFTPGLLARLYTRNGVSLLPADPAQILSGTAGDRGGYVDSASLLAAGLFPASDVAGWWWIPSGRVFLSPTATDTAAVERAHARAHFYLQRRYRSPFAQTTTVTFDSHDFLVVDTEDPAGNRITAGERTISGAVDPAKPGNDYRVLMPARVMDANRNRIQVVFDALGMVAGTAFLGKPEESLGDSLTGFDPDPPLAVALAAIANPLAAPHALLANATSRVLYDLFAYDRSKGSARPRPVCACTVSRETHASDSPGPGGLRVQVGLAYWDGFGQEIQRKVRAEPGPVSVRDSTGAVVIGADGQPQLTPGPVSPRWVGSGWSVFNNKGKAVRQFEPFFSDRPDFEFDVRIGISPVVCYDPLSRVVATLHADHTWDKLNFGAWRTETWDSIDTLTVADPATDPDVGDFFGRLGPGMYLPTWLAMREGGGLGTAEQEAAEKSAPLARSPSVSYCDTLGRTFLTVSQNKVRYSDAPHGAPPTETMQRAQVDSDIEGNARAYTDGKDRLILLCDYDMTGRHVRHASMDAGTRWILLDATGRPLHAWTERGHDQRTEFDALRRPVRTFQGGPATAEQLIGRTVYGESLPAPEAKNLRGRVVRTYDQAGVETRDGYDFKGNPLTSRRQLAQRYDATLDWSLPVPLHPEVYDARSRYDALNRVVQSVSPHDPVTTAGVSVLQSTFNEAGLLETIHIWSGQAAAPADLLDAASADVAVIANLDYDARGRRTRIDYGNRANTRFEFDRLTSRLRRVVTSRDQADFADDCPTPSPNGWPGCQIQDLRYTYDPAGRATRISDNAQQAIFFANRRVDPDSDYTYDAIGQLIEARGREHLGQAGPLPHDYHDAARIALPAIGDGHAIGRYRERYTYDDAGNIAQLKHVGTTPIAPGWTRDYVYAESSRLQPAQVGNRLTRTTVGATGEIYSSAGNGYDAHGNLLRAPQLQELGWDGNDRLSMTQRQAVNGLDVDGVAHQGERTYYVYGSTGARMRKVTRSASGRVLDERIYLNGFEIHRRHGVNPLTRETLHVTDGTRRVAMVQTRTQGQEPGVPARQIRYQLVDHLRSATLELDENAAVASYEEFTPLGASAYQAVGTTVEVPKRYRFTGMERDIESGFAYHGARYYAPWLGRWISADPTGIADGGNPYCYVHNNPISGVDPTGTDDKPAGLGASFQDEIKRLAGQVNDGPVLEILPDGTVRSIQRAAPTVIGSREALGLPEPTPQAAQRPPPEPDHRFGLYPMTQAKEKLQQDAIESFKRGKIAEGLIGLGLTEFMKPFEMAEQLMPYNIPDHFLSAGQYAKRWVWYDMRGQSGRGLLELAQGHGEASAAVGSASLMLAGASALTPSGLKPLPEPVIGGATTETPAGMRKSPFNNEMGHAGGDNCTRCTAAFIDTMNSTTVEMGEFASGGYEKMPPGLRNIGNINSYLTRETGVELGEGVFHQMPNEGVYVIHAKPLTLPSGPLRGTLASPHVMVGWQFFGENTFYDPQINQIVRALPRYMAFPLKF